MHMKHLLGYIIFVEIICVWNWGEFTTCPKLSYSCSMRKIQTSRCGLIWVTVSKLIHNVMRWLLCDPLNISVPFLLKSSAFENQTSLPRVKNVPIHVQSPALNCQSANANTNHNFWNRSPIIKLLKLSKSLSSNHTRRFPLLDKQALISWTVLPKE